MGAPWRSDMRLQKERCERIRWEAPIPAIIINTPSERAKKKTHDIQLQVWMHPFLVQKDTVAIRSLSKHSVVDTISVHANVPCATLRGHKIYKKKVYPPVLPANILQHSVSTDFTIYTNQMQTQHVIDKKKYAKYYKNRVLLCHAWENFPDSLVWNFQFGENAVYNQIIIRAFLISPNFILKKRVLLSHQCVCSFFYDHDFLIICFYCHND